jgi:hypothetical protein
MPTFANNEAFSSVRQKINTAIEDVEWGRGGFATVADLLSNSTLTNDGTIEGQIFTAGGFRYQRAASTATDEDATTAGGVKLYELPKFAYPDAAAPIAFKDIQLVTVGTGGDYATINEAIAALSAALGPSYTSGGIAAEIRLLTGFVMAEQVVVTGQDLGWIIITSVDAEVTIQRSALTEPQLTIYYPAFTANRGARLPIIDVLFNMDTSGTGTSRNGVFIVNGSFGFITPGSGVKNAGGRGLHVANQSTCVARSTVWTGAGEAGLRNGGAYVEVRQSNFSNSLKGLMVAGGSVTAAQNAICDNCDIGVENYRSVVDFQDGSADGCRIGLFLENGARVLASFSSIDGATQTGVDASQGSFAGLRSASVSNSAGLNIRLSGSEASAPNVVATGAGTNAVSAVNGSRGNFSAATLTGAGAHGILAESGSSINANGADASTAGTFGYMINEGAFINANNATGTLGRTANSLSRHGAIFN